MNAGDLDDFYALLAELSNNIGGPRRLADVHGRSGWPVRGVYFFFEPGETRPDGTPRVVRVGTHGLRAGSSSTLWGRLSQHRGQVRGGNPGAGNHRGSIFRLHVGACLLARDGAPSDPAAGTWGHGNKADPAVRAREAAHERRVSAYIGAMPFVWLGVDDEPGPGSDRGLIEAGSIALLSRLSDPAPDPPSTRWLGRWSDRPSITRSGLWNVNHTAGPLDPDLLATMDRWISKAVG